MRARHFGMLLLALPLCAGFGYRAVMGVWKGYEFERARLLVRDGKYRIAAPVLEGSAIGSYQLRARRLAAETRVDLWDRQIRRKGAQSADRDLLTRAAEDFLLCRCIAPGSRRSWEGLGESYDGIEWIGREQRAEIGVGPVSNPWERVGRPGRIAVGMMRKAIERAPTWFVVHDKLAMILWNYGLEEEARRALRETAEALPVFTLHWYFKSADMPRWVMEEFAEASRRTLGQVPLVAPFDQLIDLGKLELMLGRYELAVQALESALKERGDKVNLAEAHFQLGLALVGLQRFADASAEFELAAESPIFHPAGWSQIAFCAEKLGDDAKALQYLRRLRRAQPEDLDLSLRFAEVARRLQDWRAAIESLQWAKTRHPSDARTHEALVHTYLEMRDFVAASAVIDELRRWPAQQERVGRLRNELEHSRPGR